MKDSLCSWLKRVACKQALEVAEHFGICQIELETDSSQLKEALSSSSRDLAIGGGLFRDLRVFLSDQFHCHKICNVPGACNSLAHDLARRGLNWNPATRVSPRCGQIPSQFVISLAARGRAELASSNTRP
jgi:hypothetical protein